jgi:hypothetical protein
MIMLRKELALMEPDTKDSSDLKSTVYSSTIDIHGDHKPSL